MRGRKLRGEALLTLGFTVLKVGSVVWSIRLAESLFPPIALGLYLLSRRIISTLPNLTALGTSNVLQRYIPLNGDDPRANAALLSTSALLVTLLNAIVLSLFFLLGDLGTRLLFPAGSGDNAIGALAAWTIAQCAVTALHYTIYGALLGQRRVFAANLLDLLAVGVWTIAAFMYYGSRATPVLVTSLPTIAMFVTTIPAAALLIIREARKAGGTISLPAFDIWRSLIVYGSTRAGVTFFDAFLVTLAPWLLRHSMEVAGQLIIAMTLVRVVSSACSTFNPIATVAVASLLGRRDEHAVSTGVNLMVGFTTIPAIIGAAVLAPFLGPIVEVWLHTPTAIDAVRTIAPYLLLAVPAVALFHGVKGIVDVKAMFPYNLVNLIAANLALVLIYAGFSMVASPLVAAAVAVVLAHVVLAGATAYSLRSWLMSPRYFAVVRLATVSAVAWAICRAAAEATKGLPDVLGLAIGTLTMAVTFTLAVGALFLPPRPAFVQDLVDLVLRGRLPAVASMPPRESGVEPIAAIVEK